MLLVLDVGNTHTVVAAWAGAERRWTRRVTTATRTADEWGVGLRALLDGTEVDAAVVGSVVPAVTDALRVAIPAWLGVPVRVYGEGGDWGMPVRVDPATVGPDRVANALAALARHPPPLVVVDLGTATTVDAVDAAGAFVGGAIAPGLRTAADALVGRTARLPPVPLVLPPRAIGGSTVEALQVGIVAGHAALVDGLVRRMKEELGGGWCIATGGLASLVAPGCREVDAVDPDLLLDGLRLWQEGR